MNYPKKLTTKLHYQILDAVTRAGSYDPEQALHYVEERMSQRDHGTAQAFLRWVTLKKITFGDATLDTRYTEFLATQATTV